MRAASGRVGHDAAPYVYNAGTDGCRAATEADRSGRLGIFSEVDWSAEHVAMLDDLHASLRGSTVVQMGEVWARVMSGRSSEEEAEEAAAAVWRAFVAEEAEAFPGLASARVDEFEAVWQGVQDDSRAFWLAHAHTSYFRDNAWRIGLALKPDATAPALTVAPSPGRARAARPSAAPAFDGEPAEAPRRRRKRASLTVIYPRGL